MTSKQQKYSQTENGKAKHVAAVRRYQAKFVQLKILVEPDLMDAINNSVPLGVSRQAYIKQILRTHIDSLDSQ